MSDITSEVATDPTHATTAADDREHLESINVANFQTGSRAYLRDADTLYVLDKDSVAPRSIPPVADYLWTGNSYGDDATPGRWIEECLYCPSTGPGGTGPEGPTGPTGDAGPAGSDGFITLGDFQELLIPTNVQLGHSVFFITTPGFVAPRAGLVDVWVSIGATAGGLGQIPIQMGFTAAVTLNGGAGVPVGIGGAGIIASPGQSNSALIIGRRVPVAMGDLIQVQVLASGSSAGGEIDPIGRPTTDSLRVIARFYEN